MKHSQSFLRLLIPLACLGALLVAIFVAQLDEEATGGSRTEGNNGDHSPDAISGLGQNPSLPPVAMVVNPATPGDQDRVAANGRVFDAFREWASSLQQDPAKRNRPGVVDEGLRLATARRELMKALIESDPRAALEMALPLHLYAALPDEVRALVEEPFSELAKVDVLPICGDFTPESAALLKREAAKENGYLYETVMADDSRLRSYIYGRREEIGSKSGIPVQGIRLDGVAALREDVLQRLLPEEMATAEGLYETGSPDLNLCFATGRVLGDDAVVAVAGGKLFRFENADTLEAFNKRIGALDLLPGPQAGSVAILLPMAADGGADAGFDMGAAEEEAENEASAWTETPKDVLYIRVDFPDLIGEPVTQAAIEGVLATSVSPAIDDMSYGKTNLVAEATSTVLTMPGNATFYANDSGTGTSRNNDLLNDAKTAATTAGYNMGDYDIIAVYFSGIAMKMGGVAYAGLASVGGGDQWIQGTTSSKVITHEFGHNYGLGHASFWDTSGSGGSVVGAGVNVEYGDSFDIMGSGPHPLGHFHPQGKSMLNWLETTGWIDATASGSGTYRIYRGDNPDTTGTIRGLRVTKGGSEYYWVGNRKNFPGNAVLDCGAYIVWQRPGFTRSWLIDTTPGSAGGKDDGGIALGRTYSDPAANVHITTTAKGGADPDEWVDLTVNLGPFPGNSNPMTGISGPAATSARSWDVFSATGSDIDGDPLAYYWDFGDGTVSVNSGNVSHSWLVGGTYTVEVTVSDMKGGIATDSMIVTVSDSLQTWTQRTSGVTGDLKDIATDGTTAVAVGTNFATFKGDRLTSTDGVTWSAGQFGSNEHMNAVTWTGSLFLAAGQKYNGAWEGLIKSSPDGVIWTQRYLDGTELLDIASSGIIHVAVAEDGTILRSTDLLTWNMIGPPAAVATYDFLSVAYGDGTFVIVGQLNRFSSGTPAILTSSDGLSWNVVDRVSETYLLSWQDMREVEHTNDRFLGSGFYSQIGSSLGGATWSTTLTNAVGASLIYEMGGFDGLGGFAYGNGVFIGVGTDRANANADINALSNNGTTWVQDNPVAQADRNAVTFFKDTFITVGDNGSIWQTGVFTSASEFLTWQHTNFPGLPSGSGVLEDSEPDSMRNLMEYGLGRNPNKNSGSDGPLGLPELSTDSLNPVLAGRLVLKVNMPENAPTDVTYHVRVCDDLESWVTIATKAGAGAWTWLGGGTPRIIQGSPSGGRIVVEFGDVELIVAGVQRFMKLDVVLDP